MNDFDPRTYWDQRYASGRDSGEGSRGETGQAKAEFVNKVIGRRRVASLIDWGCGDGQVLAHLREDVDYLGVDVSQVVLNKVRDRFPRRRFVHAAMAGAQTADLALSMDVLFHFPDDADYHAYLDQLFGSAKRLVLIYSTDDDARGQTAPHVRRRKFTADVSELFPPGVSSMGMRDLRTRRASTCTRRIRSRRTKAPVIPSPSVESWTSVGGGLCGEHSLAEVSGYSRE